MQWWQIVLIVVGAVLTGLIVGYGLNLIITRLISSLQKAKARPIRQPIPAPQQPPPPVEPSVPDLFAEIEYNRRLATAEFSGQLHPFQTKAWDSRGDEIHSLPPDVRTELAEAYSDMALANSITWLSTEMSRRSASLDDSYAKLKASVATRLNRVSPFLSEHSAQMS